MLDERGADVADAESDGMQGTDAGRWRGVTDFDPSVPMDWGGGLTTAFNEKDFVILAGGGEVDEGGEVGGVDRVRGRVARAVLRGGATLAARRHSAVR